MKYWLMKCEPSSYSIDDLQRDQVSGWEGVRNYQARNFMRDEMAVGDRAFYYHSNADPSGIAGTATIIKAGYPDPFQFDPTHKYFDPKATSGKPIWTTVDIQFDSKFDPFISLAHLHQVPELSDMMVLKKGSRLSVQPVTEAEFKRVIALSKSMQIERDL